MSKSRPNLIVLSTIVICTCCLLGSVQAFNSSRLGILMIKPDGASFTTKKSKCTSNPPSDVGIWCKDPKKGTPALSTTVMCFSVGFRDRKRSETNFCEIMFDTALDFNKAWVSVSYTFKSYPYEPSETLICTSCERWARLLCFVNKRPIFFFATSASPLLNCPDVSPEQASALSEITLYFLTSSWSDVFLVTFFLSSSDMVFSARTQDLQSSSEF